MTPASIHFAGRGPARGARGGPGRAALAVVHGIPSDDVVLAEGDVIGIDFACFKDGYCGDSARTVAVGVVSEPVKRLLASTREALEAAIAECVPGKRLGDVGAAVEALAASRGYSVVRDFVGHGIGRAMHEPPQVPNYGTRGMGPRLKPGMVIAIEPMLNVGGGTVRVLEDGWTVETEDRSLSAHVEHTVAITNDGPRVLTACCAGFDCTGGQCMPAQGGTGGGTGAGGNAGAGGMVGAGGAVGPGGAAAPDGGGVTPAPDGGPDAGASGKSRSKDDGGCGCRAAGSPSETRGWMIGVALGLVAMRRRRAHRAQPTEPQHLS